MIEFEKELNPEQWEAVKHIQSPLLILAGAGTGKTRVITYKIAYLIQSHNFAPSSILGVTFTNKSAKEMQERVAQLLGIKGKKKKQLKLSTFHSFGVSVIKKFISKLGYASKFSIYSDTDQMEIIKKLMEDFKISPDTIHPRLILWMIQKIKNNINNDFDTSDVKPIYFNLYKRYEEYLKNYSAFDFDDLILKPIELLKNYPDVQEYYHNKLKYILVDEYQDTNPVQYELIKLLTKDRQNVCVVGDDDQAIYSWRGSDINIILNFEKEFSGTKIVHLSQNYRSTMRILNVANSIIQNNVKRKEKKLWSRKDLGEKIYYKLCNNEDEEGEYIAKKILAFKREYNLKNSDFAVLYRTNFQSRPIEFGLRQMNLPYKVVGGQKFFDRKEIKDVISYLKVIANPKDNVSLLRIINYPRRGIGDTTIGKLNQFSTSNHVSLFDVMEKHLDGLGIRRSTMIDLIDFHSLIKNYRERFFDKESDIATVTNDLISEIQYKKQLQEEGLNDKQLLRKMDNLAEFINNIATFQQTEDDHSLYNYLNQISLLMDNDSDEKQKDQVTLMTVHSSKGLEFPFVFVAGMEDELFPHKRSVEDENNLEEERRLFYVALTRGKNRIFLTSAHQRKKFGEIIERKPSSFLEEIPKEHFINYSDPETTQAPKKDFSDILAKLQKK